jgi:hypothetical protein
MGRRRAGKVVKELFQHNRQVEVKDRKLLKKEEGMGGQGAALM